MFLVRAEYLVNKCMNTEYKCKFCEKMCKNLRSLVNHERLCKNNPNGQNISSWTHNENWREAMRKTKGAGNNQYTKAKRLGLPPPINPMFGKISPKRGRKLSEETKRKISEGRKKWIKENPDKYPWKRKEGRFVSVPCEHLKDILHSNKFEFIEEYTDETWEHKYSLDIAFPNKRFAIEVNGTQHYNRDGSLKEYYQKRHDYLVSCGWDVLELYYSKCFNNEEVEYIKSLIKDKLLVE